MDARPGVGRVRSVKVLLASTLDVGAQSRPPSPAFGIRPLLKPLLPFHNDMGVINLRRDRACNVVINRPCIFGPSYA